MKSIVFASFAAGSLGALAVLAIRDGLAGPEQGRLAWAESEVVVGQAFLPASFHAHALLTRS